MNGHQQDSDSESLTLPQAVREARGKLTYPQLWRGIQAGRIEAFQPAGRGGHYRIMRAELNRLIQPRSQK